MSKRGGFKSPHQKMAEHWDMTVADLEKAGCRLLSAAETKEATGFSTPSVEWVYRDLKGEPIGVSRWRLCDPIVGSNGKLRRYTSTKDSPVSLYLPVGIDWQTIAKDPSVTIYMTEGEAKAAWPASKLKKPVISFSGVDSWQSGGVPAAQFADIEWKGRRVVVVPDSDYRRKPGVRRGVARLGDFLAKQGARPRIRRLPDLKEMTDEEHLENSKTEVPDFIRLKGWEAFTALKVADLKPDDPEFQRWLSPGAELPEALRDLKPMPGEWFDEEPPAPEFVVDPYLQVGESAVAAGVGSVGKGFFLLPMLVSICTGTDFYGFHVPKKRRAMYAMLERSTDSFRRRIYKVMHALVPVGHPQREQFERDLKENCFPFALAGEQLNLIERKNDQWVPAAVVDSLVAVLKDAAIEVLFLDPMSRLHGADENDNSAMSAFTKALERIIQTMGCRFSIVLVHHAGKAGRDDQYGFRGGSAIGDNTSEMIILSKVENKEREKLELSRLEENERANDIVLVRHARCSDARPAADLYLLRSENGVLVSRGIFPRCGFALGGEQMAVIRKWAGDRAFTKREFRDAHDQWGRGVTRAQAESLFEHLLKIGDLERTGKKRKRGDLVKVASVPGQMRATGPLEQKRSGHSKNRGGENA